MLLLLSLLYLILFFLCVFFFFFFKQKTAYEMRISDWSSDVCSSDLVFSGYLPVSDSLKIRLGARRTKRDGLVNNISGPDMATQDRTEIGRASCRERVCQYV